MIFETLQYELVRLKFDIPTQESLKISEFDQFIKPPGQKTIFPLPGQKWSARLMKMTHDSFIKMDNFTVSYFRTI